MINLMRPAGLTGLTLLVHTLAVARLTGLATIDAITAPLRRALVMRSRRTRRTLTFLIGGTDEHTNGCPWCASIWIGAAAAPLVWFWGHTPWLFIPALALAMSQVTGMLAWFGRG